MESGMEIRQLRYFSLVAREGNISRAAEKLHVAQPALSRQIRALENEFGVSLLTRTAKGVETTEAGRRLHELADRILAEIDELKPQIAEAAGDMSGVLTAGMSPSLVPLVAEHLIEVAHTRYPKLQLQLVEGLSMFLCEWLEQGKLDVAFFTDVGPQPRLRTQALAEEEIMLVGTSEHVQEDHADLRTVAEHSLVVTPGFRAMLAQHQPEPIVYEREIDSILSVKRMVLRGTYCSLLPYSFVHEEVVAGRLRAAGFRPPVRRTVVAATRLDRPVRRPVEALIGLMRTQLAALPAPTGSPDR
jgi:LysR family transcriptional regulator, nitrogen assimilation regulatory protein